MLKFLSLLILILFSFSINPVISHSQEWVYIGHSKIPNESNFYIFTMAKEGSNPNEMLISQKHVFSTPKKISNEIKYNSVLISRSLYCSEKKISTDRAVFSDSIGSIVGKYENKASTKIFENINNNRELDLFLLNKYCKDI